MGLSTIRTLKIALSGKISLRLHPIILTGADMEKRIAAEHGIICRVPGDRFGYFGWPSIARADDGTLLAVGSGFRSQHICPWGKTVLSVSSDSGRTWSWPRIINDSPIDDRDAGIINLGGDKLLVSWFTSDTRQYANDHYAKMFDVDDWNATLSHWTDELVDKWLGSWIMLSENGGDTWSEPIRSPVTAPHGPILLSNGDLLYLGKGFTRVRADGRIMAARSADGGRTWSIAGTVPLYEGTIPDNYHEPHVVELPSGKLIGLIRVERFDPEDQSAGLINFSIFQTDSTDGGKTWSTAKPTGVLGSPPHLIRHSSGVLICVYGYRAPGFGQRAMISRDEGVTWDADWILRDDGPGGDLGYPASVELEDGSIFTVYYQSVPGDDRCSLMWSRWQPGSVI